MTSEILFENIIENINFLKNLDIPKDLCKKYKYDTESGTFKLEHTKYSELEIRSNHLTLFEHNKTFAVAIQLHNFNKFQDELLPFLINPLQKFVDECKGLISPNMDIK